MKDFIIKAEITRIYRAIEVSPEVFEKGEMIKSSSIEYDMDGNELSNSSEAEQDCKSTYTTSEHTDVVRDYNEQGELIREVSTSASYIVTREFNSNGKLIYYESESNENHWITKYIYDTDDNLLASI